MSEIHHNINHYHTSSARIGMKMVVVAMLLVKLVTTVARIHMRATIRVGDKLLKLERDSPIADDKPDS